MATLRAPWNDRGRKTAADLTATYDAATAYVVHGNHGRALLGSVPLAHNTRVGPSRFDSAGIGVTYHATEIITLLPDGGIRLNTGGYATVTTKSRLNQWLRAAGMPFSVYSKDYALKLGRTDGQSLPWADGLTVYADGRVTLPGNGYTSGYVLSAL